MINLSLPPSLQIAKIRSGHGFVAMKDSYKPYRYMYLCYMYMYVFTVVIIVVVVTIFRHLEFLTYSNIRSVIDFTDSEGTYMYMYIIFIYLFIYLFIYFIRCC